MGFVPLDLSAVPLEDLTGSILPDVPVGQARSQLSEEVSGGPRLGVAGPRVIEGSWWRFLNPVTAQTGASCSGHAFANLVEALARRTAPEEWVEKQIRDAGARRDFWQVDGARIHRAARDKWYPSKGYSGGVRLDEVAEFAQLTGLLGSDEFVSVLRVKPTWEAIVAALRVSPVLVGLFVAESWKTPDPETGWIRPRVPNVFAGHLVCAAAVERDTDGNEYLFFMNSWGPRWGRYGYGAVNFPYAKYCWIGDAVAFVTRPGWWATSTLREWVVPHDA